MSIPAGRLPHGNPEYAGDVDRYERRRRAFIALIDGPRFRGSRKRFAVESGIDATSVSRIIGVMATTADLYRQRPTFWLGLAVMAAGMVSYLANHAYS